MQRVSAVLGSALFFLVASCVLAGLIPWSMTRWEFRPAFFGLEGARSVGVLLILVGLPGLVDSFARFALQGLGTPAPVAPTKNLVVTGLYRHVRNPIYLAVVAIILGQAMLFGDWRLALLGALFWLTSPLSAIWRSADVSPLARAQDSRYRLRIDRPHGDYVRSVDDNVGESQTLAR